MRPKIIFFMAMLCAVTTSCKQQAAKEPDLSNIEAIYCMPTDPGKCLPLEIVNYRTPDKKEVHFRYDDKTKELQVPIVRNMTQGFTGQYRKIRLGK